MSKHNQAPNKLLVKGLALAVGTAALVGGTVYVDKDVFSKYDEVESDAIQEVKTADNVILAIRDGATVRTAPTMGANNKDGLPTTFAFKVEEGKVVVVDRPVEFTDDSGDNWAGFQLASKPTVSGSADASNLLWVNESQLAKDSPADDRYITEFAYSPTSMPIYPTGINVSINDFGLFETPDLKDGYLLAVGQTMSNAQFTERVSRENLDIVG